MATVVLKPGRGRQAVACGRRLLVCNGAAVAAEFAFIVPILVLVLFSIIEFGFVFIAYGSMHFAAASTARQIGVNRLAVAGAPTTAKGLMPSWIANASTVTTTQLVNVNPLKSGVKVTVSAPVRTATPLPYFTLSPNWILSASVTVRQELPYEG